MSIVPEIYHFPLSAALFSDLFLCQVLVIIEKILLRLFRQLSKSRRKEAAI